MLMRATYQNVTWDRRSMSRTSAAYLLWGFITNATGSSKISGLVMMRMILRSSGVTARAFFGTILFVHFHRCCVWDTRVCQAWYSSIL